MARVVVLGAGVSGHTAALYLRKLLPKEHEVVVVNPKPGRVEMFRRMLPAGTPILNWGCRDRGGEPLPGTSRAD